MSGTGDYVLGLLGLSVVAISVAVAGRALRRALLPEWTGAPALLANGLLAVSVLVVISELLGLFGLLNGPVLVAACVIVGGGALRLEPLLIRARGEAGALSGARQREAPDTSRWELAAAVTIAAVVALQWAGPTLLALDRGIYGGDSLWYHLPFAAHFAQSGSVTELLYVDPLYLNWFYPQNSELLHAGGLLLLGNDFLSPLINLGWLGLALAAGWCIGRPYGAGAPALAAVAALMAADLLFSRQPGNANNDVVAIALLLAAVAVLANAREPTARGPLIVAGLAAGLALGTKLTVVPAVGALTIGVIAIAVAGGRLRAAAAWGGGLLVGGGLWYARNLIVSGTPFPFVDLGPLSKPEELQGREPFSIAHYLTDTDVWGRFFRPGLEERLGELWPLALLLAVAGVVVWLRSGGRLERMLAAAALLAAIAYVLTPLGASGPEGAPVGFRLNLRYLAPGLALALVLVAIPPPLVRGGRERWWRLGSLGLFAALIAVSAGALEAIETDRIPGSLLLAGALLALPLALVALARQGVGRVPLAAAAAVAVIGLAVAGRLAQEDYLELRYLSSAPAYPTDEHPATELEQGLGVAFDWARGIEGARVGLAGTTGALFQYGLWGPDSSNRVRYLGERGDRGSFGEAECPEWVAEVNGRDYRFIVTTPVYDQDDPGSAVPPVERLWLQQSGGARQIAGTDLVAVWELTGPVDPIACAAAPTRPAAPAAGTAE